MTKEQAELLQAATEHCGNQEISVRTDYSGRCMYGRTTYAVVVDSMSQLMADVVSYIMENVEVDNEACKVTVAGQEVPELSAFNQDSMGRNSIVIY